MVRPVGFEPTTHGLEGRCSIRLSYGRSNPNNLKQIPGLNTSTILPENKIIGRGREIRTPDILLPKQARYQTALYPDTPLKSEHTLPQKDGANNTAGLWGRQQLLTAFFVFYLNPITQTIVLHYNPL